MHVPATPPAWQDRRILGPSSQGDKSGSYRVASLCCSLSPRQTASPTQEQNAILQLYDATAYQWWRAGQSDTDDDLVDDLEAVSTSRAAASRAPQRHTPRGAHSGVCQAL